MVNELHADAWLSTYNLYIRRQYSMKNSFMHSTSSSDLIADQQNKLKIGSPKIEIIAPCLLNDGIITCTEEQNQRFVEIFESTQEDLLIFIPSSGSGSRMFDFLMAYTSDESLLADKDVMFFLNHLDRFPFYDERLGELNKSWKASEMGTKECIKAILDTCGFAHLPKGLIPFHKTNSGILNAFQEHVLQGINLKTNKIKFHFTIQGRFENLFIESLEHVKKSSQMDFDVEFSVQDSATDSFSFDHSMKVLCTEEGEYIKRPAGHGALIENLIQIEDRFILIKNIDNVQHLDNSKYSSDMWKILSGMLFDVKKELLVLYSNPDMEKLIELNNLYHLFSGQQISECSDESKCRDLLNRPLRICGMVQNQGKAGGGPFFVKDEYHVTKQIVESVQISDDLHQQEKLADSTHFNPVMMVLDTFNFEGKRHDLKQFRKDENYFVVKKKYQGKEISFIELPGLWNGAMYYWNTIFIEIPITTFTPVKTVLDLLDTNHSVQ